MQKLRINIDFLFQLILYKALLIWVYKIILVPTFGYEGYAYEPNLIHFISGWVISLALCLIYITNRLIRSFFKILLVTYAIPLIVLFENNQNFSLIDLLILLIPLLSFVRLRYFKVKIPERMESTFKSNKWKWIFSVIGTLILLRLGSISGWKSNLQFSDVYSLREEYGVTQNSGIFGYLNNWTAKIILPLGVVHYYRSKKYITTIILLTLSFFMFNFTGHKAILIIPISAIFIYNILAKKINWILYINYILAIIIVFSKNAIILTLVSLFVRRVLFLPGLISFNYLEFFKENKVFYSHAFLKNLLDYHYQYPPQIMIGNHMNLDGSWVNSGFASTGYMNLGVFGVLLYSIILRMIFSLILGADSNNKTIITVLCLSTITIFTSAGLLTTILTNGLILLIIYAIIHETKNRNNYDAA